MAALEETTKNSLNLEAITQDVLVALSQIEWKTWAYVGLYILIGIVSASFLSSIVGRILSKYTSKHYTLLVKRLFYYGIIILFTFIALITLHLDSKVLGIATVLTIALGFASQTAVSNTISGLFLVFEKPFQVGDHIEMGDLIGELLSIDLLSIKIRTFQNSLVRVPNELLLKSQFINLTRFPIRRLDIPFRISVKEDVQRVRKIINDTAAKNLNALETPAPILFFEKFDDYAIELRFSVWVRRELFMEFKNGFSFEIQQALKDNDVLMPVAQMNLLRHNH